MSVRIIALDTATEACSVALLEDGAIVAERFEVAPRQHASLILPQLETVLSEAEWSLGDISALAFGRGPGAFTGVRIAASVAQGIAFAADLPVLPVSDLAALALDLQREHNVEYVAAAIDARMGEVYWGYYKLDAELGMRLLGEERVLPPATVPQYDEYEWCGVGSGWASYGDQLRTRLKTGAVWPDRYPKASAVALLAERLWQSGQAVAAEHATPVYLRDRVTDPR